MKKIYYFSVLLSLVGKLSSQGNLCLNPAPYSPLFTGTPFSFASPDLNSDGFKDLVIPGSNGLNIFLSINSTSYQTTFSTWNSGSLNHFVIEKDFNNDGNADLAACGYNDNNVNVWLGTGTGTFSSLSQYSTTSSPNSITSGDFNNDGFFDIASADYSSGFGSVLYNNGSGGFYSGPSFTAGINPKYILTSNFNNDAYLDLAVNNGSVITIFQGNSTGLFNSVNTQTLFFSSITLNNYSFIVRDINNDNNSDLIGISPGGQAVKVVLGNGNFTFQSPLTYTIFSIL